MRSAVFTTKGVTVEPAWRAFFEGHGFKKKANRDAYHAALVAFFREFLLS